MNVMEESVVTLLLLLPRPWLAVEERQARRQVGVDVDGGTAVLDRGLERGGDLYAAGTIRDADGSARRRLPYWHKVVLVRGPSETES